MKASQKTRQTKGTELEIPVNFQTIGGLMRKCGCITPNSLACGNISFNRYLDIILCGSEQDKV